VKNLDPDVTEPLLMETFGDCGHSPLSLDMDLAIAFNIFSISSGDIASIKIMWPRTDEEKERTSNRGRPLNRSFIPVPPFSLLSVLLGFVSFMTRDGAEKAMERLQDADLKGSYIKLGWGTYPLVLQFSILFHVLPC
jgi:RNA recognition motif-containing protein